jgi:hypothetical protein
MTTPPFGRSGAILLLLATVFTSCGPAAPQRVLTVEELVPQIDALNGETVSVAGYLRECGGYDCGLYRTKGDSDEWDRFMMSSRANSRMQVPDVPVLSIGASTNFDFDAMAAPFTHSYVVITGTITNQCRFEGRPACTDRGPDLIPTSIRAGRAPAR